MIKRQTGKAGKILGDGFLRFLDPEKMAWLDTWSGSTIQVRINVVEEQP